MRRLDQKIIHEAVRSTAATRLSQTPPLIWRTHRSFAALRHAPQCRHLQPVAGCDGRCWLQQKIAERWPALREDAPGSNSSQLLQHDRQAAGATTHRPLRSMSRRVSDAPHMRSPHSRRRRGRGSRRPLNGDFARYPTPTNRGIRVGGPHCVPSCHPRAF